MILTRLEGGGGGGGGHDAVGGGAMPEVRAAVGPPGGGLGETGADGGGTRLLRGCMFKVDSQRCCRAPDALAPACQGASPPSELRALNAPAHILGQPRLDPPGWPCMLLFFLGLCTSCSKSGAFVTSSDAVLSTTGCQELALQP